MPAKTTKPTAKKRVRNKIKLSPAERKERQKKKEGHPSNDDIEDALKNTFGRISVVARMFNFDRTTIYQRIDKHPRLKRALEESRSLLVPYAETKLMANVANGDQRAIEFVLKNKGKGWNVNGAQEQEGAKDLNFVINLFQQAIEETKPEPASLPESTVIDVKKNEDGNNGAG